MKKLLIGLTLLVSMASLADTELNWQENERIIVRAEVADILDYKGVAKEEVTKISLKRQNSYDDATTFFSSNYIARYEVLVEYQQQGTKCKEKLSVDVKFSESQESSKRYRSKLIDKKCINLTQDLQEFEELQL